eukprot:TRINITY_DN9675_c1_g1_i1.p1 TRINITY_DN9675_c1_g1~~TRINITY_DN9675_c1_g1_i1.p1  ORF type:complete len:281 (+),score=4.85 TRINITY_DN9675_c1_g1_i1:53-844(+)
MDLNLIGSALLLLGTTISGLISLISWQSYSRHPSLENAVLLMLVLSQAYSSVGLLCGALLPLKILYQNPDKVEMLHRSRYLIFDCISLPCIVWITFLLSQKPDANLGPFFLGSRYLPRSLTVLCLSILHLYVSYFAAQDCSRYPFSMENCLGVMYWRPSRFTARMKNPWQLVIRILWVFALCSLAFQGRFGLCLLTAVAAFHGAFYGHMSPYQYWSGEIFVQSFASAGLSAALLAALDISVSCSDGFSMCTVATPGGAIPLLG